MQAIAPDSLPSLIVTGKPIVTDNYLNSEFLCKLSGSQISIILYQLEAIPQKNIDEDPEYASDRDWETIGCQVLD